MKVAKVMTGLFLCVGMAAHSQNAPEYGDGLKINIDGKKEKYIRFMLWNQIWVRQIDNNPGTVINDVPKGSTFDVGARRLRLLTYAQLSPRFIMMAHLGINNQTFINGGAAGTSGTGGYGAGKKPGIFFHDFTSEYAIVPARAGKTFSLSLGAGLHSWMGLSRITMASTTNFLTVDSPVFTWPTVENSDQFTRMYGIYLKGKADRLEYRLSVNKPFATNMQPVVNGGAVDNNGAGEPSVGGYAEWQFLDTEANTLPFKVGTYLGTKRVFNIGAGFYAQNDGTKSVSGDGKTHAHNIRLYSADVFADLPVGSRKMAVTAYSAFYHYDFGPDYIRYMGTMNLGSRDPHFSGMPSLAGVGNARPMIGTGNNVYVQSGLLLPDWTGHDKVRLQPFAAWTFKALDALEKNGHYWDAGANLFIQQHHAKITLQYSARPDYTTPGHIRGHRGEWVLQFQTFL